jgi:hypothetical protein
MGDRGEMTGPTHRILKDVILGDLDRVILPRLSHCQHSRLFGYFTGVSAQGRTPAAVALRVTAQRAVWIAPETEN